MLAGVMDALASQRPALSLTTCRWCASAILISPGMQRRASRRLTWDLDQMGRVAASILLDRILRRRRGAARVRPVYLPTRFILRHSGAKPRAP